MFHMGTLLLRVHMSAQTHTHTHTPEHRVEERAHGVLDLERCEHANSPTFLVVVKADTGDILHGSGVVFSLHACVCVGVCAVAKGMHIHANQLGPYASVPCIKATFS
jgi:hypothetical protein